MCAIQTTPAVAAERLVLRSPRLSDAQRLADLANDIGVAGNLSRMPYPYSRQDAEAFLARTDDLDWNHDARFAIEHRDAGLIGMIGLERSGGLGPELGYWLGRNYWGQGYATEAARAALDWARAKGRAKVAVAGHHVDNPASGQVLCKAGFLYTGDVEPRASLARGEDVPTRLMVWLA